MIKLCRLYLICGTLHKNYMNLHVAVHHTVTNLEKGVCITNVCYPSLRFNA